MEMFWTRGRQILPERLLYRVPQNKCAFMYFFNVSLHLWPGYSSFFQKIAHPILYKTLWKEQFEWLTMELYRVNITMLYNNTLSIRSFPY